MLKQSSSSVEVFWLDREVLADTVKRAVLRLAKRRPEVERVVLFGSLARGDAVPGSDVDLLVVLSESAQPFLDRLRKYRPAGIPVGVDVFPYTEEELRRMTEEGNAFVQRALSEGIVLFERTQLEHQEFDARLELMGAWVCLRVPFSVEEVFGTKARLAVKGTVNGFPFRSSVFPMGQGSFFMMVNKAMQKGAGASAGDLVHVVLERDTAPRRVTMPHELAKALAHDPEARQRFEKMPYSHKKEYVDWIVSATGEATRTKRIEKAIAMLKEKT